MDSETGRRRQGKLRLPGRPRTATWLRTVRNRLGTRPDRSSLYRWATHLSIVGIGVAVAIASRSPSAPTGALQSLAAPTPTQDIVPMTSARQQTTSSRGGRGYLTSAAVPRTTGGDTAASTVVSDTAGTAEPTTAPTTAAPAPTPEIRVYVVQPGDTVYAVARRFNLTPETILSANDALAGNPDLLKVGQELQILPVSGVLHVVQQGDTLKDIAAKYEVSVDDIVGYAGNGLVDPYVLHPDQKLIIPGGKYTGAGAVGDLNPTGVPSGQFDWPITGRLTQYAYAGHMAIDIAQVIGTPIHAADGGTVVEAGWSNVGYGNYVLVDHGNGYRTRYAHMSKILVTTGQQVAKGDTLGLVGSTGNSTGPHLHFEIYKNGVLQNPLAYLP